MYNTVVKLSQGDVLLCDSLSYFSLLIRFLKYKSGAGSAQCSG